MSVEEKNEQSYLYVLVRDKSGKHTAIHAKHCSKINGSPSQVSMKMLEKIKEVTVITYSDDLEMLQEITKSLNSRALIRQAKSEDPDSDSFESTEKMQESSTFSTLQISNESNLSKSLHYSDIEQELKMLKTSTPKNIIIKKRSRSSGVNTSFQTNKKKRNAADKQL